MVRSQWNNWISAPIAVYITVAFISILFFLGIFGNILTLLVYRKREKNSSRIFIMTLASIDLFTCIFMIPYTIIYILGYVKGVHHIIYTAIMQYLFVLMAIIFTSISIDRYFALARPLSFAFNEKKATRVVLIDAIVTIFQVTVMILLQYFLLFVFTLYIMLTFLILLTIVIVMYTLTFKALRKREKNKIGTIISVLSEDESYKNFNSRNQNFSKYISSSREKSNKKNQDNRKGREAVKTAKISLTLTSLFALAYVPFIIKGNIPISFRDVIEFFYFTNNVINFLVYWITSQRFRKECKTIINRF